jgi:hypothetical protein
MSFFTPQPQTRRRLGDAPGATGAAGGTIPGATGDTILDGSGGSTPTKNISWVKRLTAGDFVTQTDVVSGLVAGGIGLASGQKEMAALKTAGIQLGSSLIGRKIENVMPKAIDTLTPLFSFAISNAVLNSISGRKKNLLQKVAVGTAIDLGSSAFMQEESSLF